MAKVKIRTGNVGAFKTGVFSKFRVLYSGMPTSQTFALSPVVETSSLTGEASFAPVVYYSVESEVIWLLGEQFKVKEIDVNYIVLSIMKNKK